jgi:hypothetical protein
VEHELLPKRGFLVISLLRMTDFRQFPGINRVVRKFLVKLYINLFSFLILLCFHQARALPAENPDVLGR